MIKDSVQISILDRGRITAVLLTSFFSRCSSPEPRSTNAAQQGRGTGGEKEQATHKAVTVFMMLKMGIVYEMKKQ